MKKKCNKRKCCSSGLSEHTSDLYDPSSSPESITVAPVDNSIRGKFLMIFFMLNSDYLIEFKPDFIFRFKRNEIKEQLLLEMERK